MKASLLPAFVLVTTLTASPSLRGEYHHDWFTIDGGGGASTNGQYSVTGTIGQPDACALSGGSFTLVGGFWGTYVPVQPPSVAYLTIARSNRVLIVSWPVSSDGWLLQVTTNLLPQGSVWTNNTGPCRTNGFNVEFTEPLPAGRKFYRLYKP